jgi:hypothetical protein
MSQCTLRKVAVHQTGFDVDRGFVLAIQSMEVRWCMIAVVHGDHNPEEAADFRLASV